MRRVVHAVDIGKRPEDRAEQRCDGYGDGEPAGGGWAAGSGGWRVEGGEWQDCRWRSCRWQGGRWQSRFVLGCRRLFRLDGWWSGCFEVWLGRRRRDELQFWLVTRLKHLLLIRLIGRRDGYWLFCGVSR